MIWLQIAACTALILLCGWKLAFYGDIIAERTGVGRTFTQAVITIGMGLLNLS